MAKNSVIITIKLDKPRNPLYKDLMVAGKRIVQSKKVYKRNKRVASEG